MSPEKATCHERSRLRTGCLSRRRELYCCCDCLSVDAASPCAARPTTQGSRLVLSGSAQMRRTTYLTDTVGVVTVTVVPICLPMPVAVGKFSPGGE